MNKLATALLFCLLMASVSIAFSQSDFAKLEGHEDLFVQRNVMISAPDGTKLATDIYRKGSGNAPNESPMPVLLQRTPYGKMSERFVKVITHLASKGYVVAIQDLGEGELGPNGLDFEDKKDLMSLG